MLPLSAAVAWTLGVLLALAIGAGVFLSRYVKYRGKRLITCPETGKPEAVDIDALDAAISTVTSQPNLHLQACTRWPERAHCGQECLRQIELAPDGCLVRTIVERWYEGKSCAFCAKPIRDIRWADQTPALVAFGNNTISWKDVAPERLPEILRTHRPVCWSCHVTETMLRTHPDDVVIRPSESERHPHLVN